MSCTTAAFDDLTKARHSRRALMRQAKLYCSIEYCELCSCYHLKVAWPCNRDLAERDMEILKLRAQGLVRWEIARELKMAERNVETRIEMMCKKFYAVNSTHLIAIAIALGFIDPNLFVPTLEEAKHA